MDKQVPRNKKFYGSVTVSERGQIVVPAEARKDFNIKAGDKLLVLADLEEGLWIATFPIIEKYMSHSADLSSLVRSTMDNGPDDQQPA